VITHDIPVQSSPQPTNREPRAAAALSSTRPPFWKAREHPGGQRMPAGTLDTDPIPVPILVTTSTRSGAVNVPSTVLAWSSVIMHGPVPEHGGPQPTNVESTAGVASRRMIVPVGYVAEQVAPHSISGHGALTIEPLPLPVRATVNVVGGPVRKPTVSRSTQPGIEARK
jgi:hypothetical protein